MKNSYFKGYPSFYLKVIFGLILAVLVVAFFDVVWRYMKTGSLCYLFAAFGVGVISVFLKLWLYDMMHGKFLHIFSDNTFIFPKHTRKDLPNDVCFDLHSGFRGFYLNIKDIRKIHIVSSKNEKKTITKSIFARTHIENANIEHVYDANHTVCLTMKKDVRHYDAHNNKMLHDIKFHKIYVSLSDCHGFMKEVKSRL